MPTTRLTETPQAAGREAPTPQQRSPHRTPAEAAEAARANLRRDLKASFNDYVLESGMNHPAEKIIDAALSEHKELAYQWLAELCIDEKSASFASDVLFCLGRKPGLGTPEWRLSLVRNGLKRKSVQVRDAAAQAAEEWMDGAIAETLKAHIPSETEAWLREYIEELVAPSESASCRV